MIDNSNWWGQIPHGFSKIVGPSNTKLLVKNGYTSAITPAISLEPEGFPVAEEYHGRNVLRRVKLGRGESGLIRTYLHGGVLRWLTRDLFMMRPARPFRELNITEELRRRGVPTVEVCGAGIEVFSNIFYRGWLVTRELVGSYDWWEHLRTRAGWASDITVLRSVAESLRRMHRQGVYHADLNLKNILVLKRPESVETYVIDFDRATLFLGPLPLELARKNLARLHRSVRKLDAEEQYLSEAQWQRFLDFYYEEAPA